MKTFLIFLILIFCFQFWAKADVISDFEIEGISIGDSSLEHFSEDELSNARKINYPNSKKFYEIILEKSSDNYDSFKIAVKKDDEKYIIYAITGSISFTGEEDKCLTKKKEIDQNFMNILPSLKKNNYKHVYKTVDDGKSYSHVTDFDFKDGSAIRIWCNFFTKATLEKRNFFNGLSVSISSIEFLNWLNDKAYR